MLNAVRRIIYIKSMRNLACLSVFAALLLPPGRALAVPTLTMWGPELEKSLNSIGFDSEVAAFEKRYNCKVNRLSMGAGGMDPQKLSTAIAGGVPPDLVRQDRFTVGDWASRDAFQILDDLVKRDRNAKDGIREKEFYAATWQEAVYKGHIYAIPDSTDDRALFYNKALFRAAGLDPNKPPRTWEDLLAIAPKLTKRGADGGIKQIGFMPNYGNVWLYMYSWQSGGEFMSPDGRKCTLANPFTTEALQFFVNMTNAVGGRVKVDAFSSGFRGDALDPFLTGKVAMKTDGNWFMDGILRYNPTLDFGVVPSPVPAARLRGEGRFAGQPPYITWSGGFSWAIPRAVSSEQRELAWKFIKFDESLEGQRIRWTAQRASYAAQGRPFLPQMRANQVVNATIMKEFLPNRPRVLAAMKVYMDLMKVSKFRPVTFVGQRLWDEHVRAMDRAVRGMNPHEALLAGQISVQKELDKAFAREHSPEVPAAAYKAIIALALALIAAAVAWVLYHMRSQGRNGRAETRAAYMFAAPWIIGFLVFTLGPILMSIMLSFCDYDVLHAPRWLALANYQELLSASGDRPILIRSFWNAGFMSVVGIPLTMMAGLAIALLLNAKVKGMHYYRTAYYLPSIAPVVANAILWLWLLNPQYGIIDHVWGLTLTKWFGLAAPNWMTDENWSKPAFILMGVWGAGSGMILWLAGLQGIPQHLYEAAELDGAGVWGKFRNVMLPLLTPTIFFLAVMGIIGSLQIFEIAYIMGGIPLGSPADSTMMPVVLLFQNAFQYFKMGYASALAWILFVVIMIITLFQLKLSQRWVHYGD
jgi:ABC-type sugar transport system permease subunit/ABC-type glycerol-3-phosphate transport system substrate-binding protein